MRKFLTPTILYLSVISFFTDIASEMLFPVLPLYLMALGYSPLVIGALEGFAEAVSGLGKVFFGHLSDRSGKRNIFIKIGYAISALSKPAIGLTSSLSGIFVAKFADRVGKGIRTAPRDALIIAESDQSVRGKAFGFHRALDTLGAVIGPVIGLLLLIRFNFDYSKIFFFAIIPGLLAVLFTFLIKKEKSAASPAEIKKAPTLKTFIDFWRQASPMFKKMVLGFTMFSFVNSSNVFLILRTRDLGLPDLWILGVYIVYNTTYALASYPLGALGDRYGFKNTYLAGLFIFSLSYGLLGFGGSSIVFFVSSFVLYGLFSAIDDGSAKAWLSLHVPPEFKATGLGLQLSLSAIGFFVSSVVTGVLYITLGGTITFILLSMAGLFVITYFIFIVPDAENKNRHI